MGSLELLDVVLPKVGVKNKCSCTIAWNGSCSSMSTDLLVGARAVKLVMWEVGSCACGLAKGR